MSTALGLLNILADAQESLKPFYPTRMLTNLTHQLCTVKEKKLSKKLTLENTNI